MKLTWHIVMKDLRRLRWVLLLLGVVVVGQYIAWGWVRAVGSASDGQRGAVLGHAVEAGELQGEGQVGQGHVVGRAKWLSQGGFSFSQ